ncbi:MAG: serine/threonine-protein kinase [Minicystis sp.]
MTSAQRSNEPASRYELLFKIGEGGTASVHLARLTGHARFSRLVAVKRPHPHILGDPASYASFVAEASVASKIHHANVVAVLDVEATDDELLLVMDYIEGVSLAELLDDWTTRREPLPTAVALRILLDASAGLTAVHELEDELGRPLRLLHRDVSPQNILVGIDGTARLSDLGLAKRRSATLTETEDALVGKLAYLAPELIDGVPAGVKTDLFALGVVIWEALAGRRLFRGSTDTQTVERLRGFEPEPLSGIAPALGDAFDEMLRRALDKDPARRWASVRELAVALEEAARGCDRIASSAEVSTHVRAAAAETLKRRRELLRALGGDGSTGLKSTQTAPLIVPPAKVQGAALTAEIVAAQTIQAAVIDEAPPEPPARRMSLAARSRLAGVACALVLVGSAAAVWIAGPDAPPALSAPTVPAVAPAEPPAPVPMTIAAPVPARLAPVVTSTAAAASISARTPPSGARPAPLSDKGAALRVQGADADLGF